MSSDPAAGDDGRPDARLVAALAADDGSPAARSEVWAALATARVFLPLAAQRHAETGSAADMVLVLIGSASGARALPAFTDGRAVQRWRPEARPVPVPGPQACQTALDDGAQALLLDPTGPALSIGGSELAELADGRVPVAGTGLSTRRVVGDSVSGLRTSYETSGDAPSRVLAPVPDSLLAALGRALGAEPGIVAARLLAGPDGPVVGLVLRGPARAEPVGADPAWLARLAERVRARLGRDLPPAGLDLTVIVAEGPGRRVPLTRPSASRHEPASPQGPVPSPEPASPREPVPTWWRWRR